MRVAREEYTRKVMLAWVASYLAPRLWVLIAAAPRRRRKQEHQHQQQAAHTAEQSHQVTHRSTLPGNRSRSVCCSDSLSPEVQVHHLPCIRIHCRKGVVPEKGSENICV